MHKESEKRSTSRSQQSFISNVLSGGSQQTLDVKNEFYFDLCNAMAQSNIPWNKLEQPAFRAFLEKYCNRHIPSESTLRKNYLQNCYQAHLDRIREKIGNNNIYFEVDETTDACGRYVANMLVGILSESEPPESYLINIAALEKTNHSTVARFINDSLTLLYAPNPVKSENIKLMLSDAAAYMIKAGKALQVFYPNLNHFTCMAHGLNRLAELVRLEFSDINNLINNGKKAFLKAPLRIEKYRQMAPDLPLPPEPIITRWGTWLNAAVFYADNFQQIKNCFLAFDDESAALKICKDCVSDIKVLQQLAFIKAHFSMLATAINDLEATQLPLINSFQILEKVVENLKLIPGDIGKKIMEKMDGVLHRNPGYVQMKRICNILKGQIEDIPDMNPEDIASMKYAPITSCDVERSFSAYKNVLTDKRHNFTMENLNHILVIYCNSNI